MSLSVALGDLTRMPAGKTDHFIWDGSIPCFGVRLRGVGDGSVSSATFVFQYRCGAKQRRFTLGRAAALDYQTVRSAVSRMYLDVKQHGADPVGARFATLGRRKFLHEYERDLNRAQALLNTVRKTINENRA